MSPLRTAFWRSFEQQKALPYMQVSPAPFTSPFLYRQVASHISPHPSPQVHAAIWRSFELQEELLYVQLSGLCRDSQWLESYMGSAMMMLKELYQVIPLGCIFDGGN